MKSTVKQFQRIYINTTRNSYYKILSCRHIHEEKPPFIHDKQEICADPSDVLHKYLKVPLFQHKHFSPSNEVLQEAQPYFSSDEENSIDFLSYAIERGQWPDYGYPEVSVMGESNVGKSSLLRAIFYNSPDVKVKVSKKPGKTKTLHFFLCGSNFALVDFPGYGFRMPDIYKECVIDYLVHRENLRCTFLLVDRPDVGENDKDAMRWLSSRGVPFAVIFNKIDRRRSGDLVYDVLHLYKEIESLSLATCYSHIFLVSSQTLEGVAYLRAFIAVLCGLCPDECSDISSWREKDMRQDYRNLQLPKPRFSKENLELPKPRSSKVNTNKRRNKKW